MDSRLEEPKFDSQRTHIVKSEFECEEKELENNEECRPLSRERCHFKLYTMTSKNMKNFVFGPMMKSDARLEQMENAYFVSYHIRHNPPSSYSLLSFPILD